MPSRASFCQEADSHRRRSYGDGLATCHDGNAIRHDRHAGRNDRHRVRNDCSRFWKHGHSSGNHRQRSQHDGSGIGDDGFSFGNDRRSFRNDGFSFGNDGPHSEVSRNCFKSRAHNSCAAAKGFPAGWLNRCKDNDLAPNQRHPGEFREVQHVASLPVRKG